MWEYWTGDGLSDAKAGRGVELTTTEVGHFAKLRWFSRAQAFHNLQGMLATFENLTVIMTFRLTGFIKNIFLKNSERVMLTCFIIA